MSTAQTTYMRPGYHSITPYLIVNDAGGLLDFLKKAYGAEEALRVPDEKGGIRHAEVRIGDSVVALADATPQYPPRPAALHLYVPDADAIYARAIEAGAESLRAPADQFYGDRESGVRDRSGNTWWIATRIGAPAGHHIPEGLRSVTPFLHPKSVTDLIRFLKLAFDAEEGSIHRDPDGRVLHAAVKIGDSMLEMGEPHGEFQPMPTALQLYVPDVDRTYSRALEAGATSDAEPENKPYGDRMAGVTDAFGTSWFIGQFLGG